MNSRHCVVFGDSRRMDDVEENSVDLVVTSPPYPMIEMWDDLFSSFSSDIAALVKNKEGAQAFELMHKELDQVWKELNRVVKPSGFVCINIGDATRKMGQDFQLYSNHSRIIHAMVKLGFQPLPVILWQKSTNSPNKFMGSGMLPAGAYVTLEHEYILIFRKGGKREFSCAQQKQNRNESAMFWEERNTWYSDTWRLKGVRQNTGKDNLRQRNAAFLFELPHRLINMYSVKGDTVFDPFLGTGTTLCAAIVSERNSIGMECDENFANLIAENIHNCAMLSSDTINTRLAAHKAFILSRLEAGRQIKHHNPFYDFPVVTRQETQIRFHPVLQITCENLGDISVEYSTDIKKLPVIKPQVKNTDPQLLLF